MCIRDRNKGKTQYYVVKSVEVCTTLSFLRTVRECDGARTRNTGVRAGVTLLQKTQNGLEWNHCSFIYHEAGYEDLRTASC